MHHTYVDQAHEKKNCIEITDFIFVWEETNSKECYEIFRDLFNFN